MAKKKLKKLLKGLGVGAALLGAGKALMNRRDRKNMLSGADANEGFIDSMVSKSLPMAADIAPLKKPVKMTSANVQRGLIEAPYAGAIKRLQAMDKTGTAGDIMGEASMLGFKKGGRVGCGIAKKGFGKAMKRRKK